MKLSNGVEWGLHCCVSLSQSAAPIPATRLAELHGVSPAYLAKHLQSLSRAGIVITTPGVTGGYELTRAASEITALDVMLAVDGDTPAFRCTEIRQRGPLAATAEQCSAQRCSIARAMAGAEQAWHRELATITIANLAANIDADSGGTALGDLRSWFAAAS